MNAHPGNASHWYRELWPWLLMAGPAAVVVAGAITAYLAVVTSDGLVADDYYKQGLAINQTLARDVEARQLGLRAQIEFAPDFGRVEVVLEGGVPAASPLVLHLAHPGRPSFDKALLLTSTGNGGRGGHASAFPALTPGRWQITLEDQKRTWRLVGDVVVPGRATIALSPTSPR